LLLFYLKPFHYESLTGLFYRTAKENRMDNLSWIKDNFFEFSGHKLNDNFINWGDPKVIGDISRFLEIDLEVSKKMTFTYLLDAHNLKVDTSKNKIKCPWFLYKTTKVCPECVKESPYHRMHWSFTYSAICSKHKILLKDKCQSCNRDFTIKSVINDKCICGMSISSTKSESVYSPLLLEYQTEIDKFFKYDTTVYINDWISNSTVFFNSLEFLATWIPQTIDNDYILSIENIKYSGNAVARTRLKKSKTLIQAIPLYLHSFKILKEWPTQFYEYINLIKDEGNSDKFRIFYNTLNKFIGTNLEPIYSEFMNYIIKNQLHDENPDQIASLKQACLLTKLKEDTLKKSDFFNQYKCTFKEIEFFFINKKDIQSWLFQYNETISKEELRHIWGTSSKVTFNILSNSILKPVINLQMGSVQKWEIPRKALQTFNLKLQERSTVINGSEILLNKAFQWVGVNNSFIVIQAMLTGILPFELNSEKFGNTLISKKILFKATRKITLSIAKKNSFISIQDATFLLGVKKSDIEYWIITKRLDKNCDTTLTYKSFKRFESKFFTTFQLSYIKRLNIKSIIKKAGNKKLEIVAGPSLNDGQRLLFKKSVIKYL
jgi:hypothetical protein